jgi:alanine-glyoxylate transaminase/(R)-3-amino-2-methylpropionate-pyruvate transaminase
LKDAFKLINNYGGVTIADEVQTGFGRTGEKFWGFEMKNNDAIPDMITMAKGMGNGVGIIGAVVCRKSIAEAFTTKVFFNTYGCNPVACAASRAVLKVIDEENIIENCKNMGKLFNIQLSKLCRDMPNIYKEIRGSGLFQGLEIAGSTIEKSAENAYELHKRLLPLGVVVGRGSAEGNVFRIQPPMCISKEDVWKVVEAIENVGLEFKKERNL